MKTIIKLQTLFVIFLITTSGLAQDIKEWRGSNRNGVYSAESLLNKWPDGGPELLWSFEELPDGYASLCIVDNTIYTTGKRDSLDVCIALQINGEILWETAYGRSWNGSDPKTRCTPTYDSGKLYVSSGYGDIACIDAHSGNILWKLNGYEKWNIKFCTWGIAESLIVFEDKLIFNPVGDKTTTVAINKENGETIWESKSINDSTAYTSPIQVKYAYKDILINASSSTIYGVNLADGNILWTFKYYDVHTPTWHHRAPIINCNSPVFSDNRIYVTSGYNHCGVMLELNNDGSDVELAWSDTLLDTHHGGVVKVGEHIFGSNWINNAKGNWVCLNWETGKKMWEEQWNTKGSIIAVNDKLVIYDERRGNVGLVDTTPEKFNLISSFRIPLGKGPHWSHPVISNGILYIRHGKALMAFKIGEEETSYWMNRKDRN